MGTRPGTGTSTGTGTDAQAGAGPNSPALRELAEALGAPPPPGLAAAAPEELALLARAVRARRESHAAGLNDAAEEALKLVPALARGPVRRILFR
ncbi:MULTISPECIES: hypothetical protein [Streptomyces]|uniref:Uncharacterized protein n=1 Tax=Streptomyces rimosus subsp. rimosus TaxID=132474 RepID=A0ABY3Z8W6_STRRM|nr:MULTISPECIES: hypothetical protein [Streptomyces]KEF03319.1 hypothetical protein DF17_29085 [Streptomyces rimosus]UNZ06587.1 hypothetical protein SRIMR7_30985 [Streptomyces rimosus subsp. rimosus]UTH98043.1 hypothetical protein SRIMHP_28360 [Streptomyces rimosus subsp. rimosus]UTJ16141.1 hypothetical protein SRIMDV3_28260 [Streptomyces rimosus subsp. rimosus]